MPTRYPSDPSGCATRVEVHPRSECDPMTLPELKSLAVTKGIRLTDHGYFFGGFYYRISDWPAVLRSIEHSDALSRQLIRWLETVRRAA